MIRIKVIVVFGKQIMRIKAIKVEPQPLQYVQCKFGDKTYYFSIFNDRFPVIVTLSISNTIFNVLHDFIICPKHYLSISPAQTG